MARVSEIAYAPTPEVIVSSAITEKEQAIIAQRMKEIDLLLKVPKAKYKLEVAFNGQRSHTRPYPGIITFWENENKLHGGGDTKLYVCPSKELNKDECQAIIPDRMNTHGFLVCMNCGGLWQQEQVYGEVFCRLTTQNWALALLNWFRRMGLDADIRIKFARDDIRHAAALEQERQRGGDLLGRVRNEERRSTAIYRLANIMRDAAGGRDLYSCIHSFLKA